MIRLFFRLIALMVRIVVVTAVAAVASAVIVLNLADFDAKRQWIELTIERLTGRDVTVAGKIDLEYSLPPRITVGDIRIANPSWASRPDMLRVKRLELEIDPLKLVFGEIAVPRVKLVGVDIIFETDRNGAANWDMDRIAGR